ncbi:hypothetical protein GCM10010912_27470 [Paenibacillus albidus]|uniref:Uncharacterized protein n=1 Tax=Paenibacillus albidus TaxID=2041023 RepID=A0A917FHD7_9BACL|nr:hypothetical protein [Paenibacillus albidus]GGF80837.1 hypothetical protein GCM10010912_27470 [Paenibacillus albidus]
MSAILECSGLIKSYGKNEAVRHLNMTLEENSNFRRQYFACTAFQKGFIRSYENTYNILEIFGSSIS